MTTSINRRATCAALLAATVLLAGCSKAPYELAPVTGKVTIDGQPFNQGKVMFAPIAAGESREVGRPAFGRLEADGAFSLGTYGPGDGAVVGEHWVTVIHIDPDEAARNENRDPDAPPPPRPASQKKFSRVAVPTKVTVVSGQDNVIDVSLTTQQVVQYGTFD